MSNMNEINCPPVNLDDIAPGNRVSWQSSTGYEPRRFGKVRKVRKSQGQRYFHVTDDDGIPRVIPGRFITKECG